MTINVEELKRKEKEGRALLQMRPLDKDAYAVWSESARKTVGESLGDASDSLSSLVKARRSISVRYETDPSYYLTQMGANLRRELSVLKRCISEVGDAASDDGGAPRDAFRGSAQLAASMLKRKGSTAPDESKLSRSHARKKTGQLLVLTSQRARGHEAIRSALEGMKGTLIHSLEDIGKLHGFLDRTDGVGGCVVVLTDTTPARSGEESGSGPCPRASYALGVLVGHLGPSRVCALYPEGMELPFYESGILQVSLQDPEGWRTRIHSYFRDSGLELG